jgi:hypothetical protein
MRRNALQSQSMCWYHLDLLLWLIFSGFLFLGRLRFVLIVIQNDLLWVRCPWEKLIIWIHFGEDFLRLKFFFFFFFNFTIPTIYLLDGKIKI